jgi:hypothetical protein
MLECFVNGLRNKALATALRHLKPKTLEEAVKMIKKEEKELVDETFETVDELVCSHDCQVKIAELSKEIALLRRKIDTLVSSTFTRPSGNNLQPRRFARMPERVISRTSSRNQNYRPILKCHNCNKPGHFANACSLPKRCYNCGRNGHISKFCRQGKSVNCLHMESKRDTFEENTSFPPSADADVESVQYPMLSVSNRFGSLDDECNENAEENEEIYMTESTPRRIKQTTPKVNKKTFVRNSTLLDRQVAFIEGRGPRPMAEEMESSLRPRKSANFYNKPVIKCRLNGDRVSTLMDSGATCNLLSKEAFKTISGKDGCRLQTTNNRVSCANDTTLNCLGEVSLHFSLGGITTLVKFLVVDGLRNCQAIVGLRTMKKLGIQFDFKNDCVILNDIIIPFESYVSPATTVQREGNDTSLN